MQALSQIDEALRKAADLGEVPGVVAVAATAKEIIYEGAFGRRDLGKDEKMTADSVFWIASMTKAITCAAAMQLVEQGKLALDEPIAKILPELAAPKVLEGFDDTGKPRLRDAKRQITQIRTDAARERDDLRTAPEARAAALESAREDLRARADHSDAEADRARADRDRTASQAAGAHLTSQITDAAAAVVTASERAASEQDNDALRVAIERCARPRGSQRVPVCGAAAARLAAEPSGTRERIGHDPALRADLTSSAAPV